MEKIEIEVFEEVLSGSRRFNVRTDGRLADGLGFDEMLGLVASLTMPERRPCLYWMKDQEPNGHNKSERRINKPGPFQVHLIGGPFNGEVRHVSSLNTELRIDFDINNHKGTANYAVSCDATGEPRDCNWGLGLVFAWTGNAKTF